MPTVEEMLAQLLERETQKEQAAQAAAAAAAEAERQANLVTKTDLEAMFTTFGETVKTNIATEVANALPTREAGAGRVGEVGGQEDPREADPVAYIVAKTREGTLSDEDKELAWALTKAEVLQGWNS